MKNFSILAFCSTPWIALVAVLLVGVGGPSPVEAQTISIPLTASQDSDCEGVNCCADLKASVSVGPNGTWTVNVTDTGDNPVAITTQSTSSETTTTYAAAAPGSPGTGAGNTLATGTTTRQPPNAMNTQAQAAGVVTGSSPNVQHGEAQDNADHAEEGGLDIDSVTKFKIIFSRPCGTGCLGEGCVYEVKFTVTSDEGFTVTATP